MCWIKGGHTVHLPIVRLLLPIGAEPTPVTNSASKVPGI